MKPNYERAVPPKYETREGKKKEKKKKGGKENAVSQRT